jgi:dolichol-phosphate mannosyltransferase
MHRFIPVLAAWQGAKVIEMPVHHRARTHGKSHYGLKRTWKVLLDLLTVKFLHTYVSRPMHFFGGIGMVLVSFGLATGVASAVLKWVQLRDFVETPLLLLSVFLLIIGVLFMVMGLLAELLIRIYFEQHGRAPYRITETVHVPSERS